MSGARVALSLGSNQGDRLARLAGAVTELSGSVTPDAVSAVYESDPVGHVDQPRFLNAALVGRTELEPLALLDAARAAESKAGRERTFRNGPRTLDVDLILWGERTLTLPRLRIPHPRWKLRSFVLAPLAEIVPDWMDPETGRTVLDLWTGSRDELPPVQRFAPPSSLLRSEP